jgi:8-oxo-dGTP pyrophosphatase MutT (NUDIX family)
MKLPTRKQVSAGGVVFRSRAEQTEVILICVGEGRRWQLPKGLVDAGETPEQAAAREVREETGVEGDLLAPLETIEYWYVANERGERVRFHKFVHYFLFRYRAGDVSRHDHEVIEARWTPIVEAQATLAFANERHVVERAAAILGAM